MPLAAWIAIGVFVAGVMWAVIWWAFQRQISRLDALEHHMHEPDGCIAIVRASIGRCVTDEDLDLNLGPVTKQLERVVEEGRERERRLSEGMERLSGQLGASQTTIRTDISGIHARIDNLYQSKKA